jgi:hypothetical protein
MYNGKLTVAFYLKSGLSASDQMTLFYFSGAVTLTMRAMSNPVQSFGLFTVFADRYQLSTYVYRKLSSQAVPQTIIGAVGSAPQKLQWPYLRKGYEALPDCANAAVNDKGL